MHNHVVASNAVGGKMASAAVYAVSSGYLNSTKLGGPRGVGGSSYDPEAQVLLNNMSVVTSTPAQDGLVSSFVEGAGDGGVFASGNGMGVMGHGGVAGVAGLGGISFTGGTVHSSPGLFVPAAPAAPAAPAVVPVIASKQPLPPPPAPAPSKKSLKKSKSPRW
jgi:hypothetical protein